MLLISGPSGGGKSTIIGQLSRHALPEAIARALPPDAAGWPVLEATNTLRAALTSGADAHALGGLPAGDRVIFHYDITHIHRFALDGYETDPALDLIARAGDLDIVCVMPEQSALLTQFTRRAGQKAAAKRGARRVWRKLVATPLRRVRALLGGRNHRTEEELYRSQDWLAQCYRQWTAYVADVARRWPVSRIVYIQPCTDSQGAPSFRLLSVSSSRRSMGTGGVALAESLD